MNWELKPFAERLKEAKAQRLPNGKGYAEANFDDWREAISIHRALGRRVTKPDGRFITGATSLAYQQQEGSYRFYIGVLNEDRRARGLPLIEM